MPIFDYKCDCGKIVLDKMVKKYDDIILCECGKTMQKGVSAPNVNGMDKYGRSGDTKLF